VAQLLPREHIDDVRHETQQRLLQSGFLNSLKPDAQVAITAGSRGMGGFVELLGGIVEAVKESGGRPFLIPAMGSHGGATEEGQIEILRRLGVTEETIGAPIRATMQTHALGTADTGAIAHLDSVAATADGIIVLARTKTHPKNTAGVASGLLKMVTVGLGKQSGAQEAHTHGLWQSVNAVPHLTMAHAKILCGVAVVENGFRQPVIVEVVPPRYDAFHDSDEHLLEAAKPHDAKIPFQQLDLLIVDELGKNISGTGGLFRRLWWNSSLRCGTADRERPRSFNSISVDVREFDSGIISRHNEDYRTPSALSFSAIRTSSASDSAFIFSIT